jgi:acetyltransferase
MSTINPYPQERRKVAPNVRPEFFYPATLIDVWVGRDGRRFMLRPVLPQDRSLLCSLVQRLSVSSRRFRFHGIVNALSEQAAQYMSAVDYSNHLAFVVSVVLDDSEKIVAEARWCKDPSGEGAEFAIVVDDTWQGMGVGKRLMQALADSANAKGLTWLCGEVLADNAPMLGMLRGLGFHCTPDLHDDTVIRVERNLTLRAKLPPARRWFSRRLFPWQKHLVALTGAGGAA